MATRRQLLEDRYGEHAILTLDQIIDFCDTLQELVVSQGRENLMTDTGTQWIAEMGLIRLGEAVSRLPDEFMRDFPEQPWRRIKGMRNVAAHQYDLIEYELVWTTVAERVLELREYVAEIVRS